MPMPLESAARRLAELLQSLADPYAPTERAPHPRVLPYLLSGLRPLRLVLALSLASTVIAAAIEVWLIAYAGRLIDRLAATGRETVWAELGPELLGVAILLLILRPLSHFAREGINDLGLRPNAATLFRWRALRHVLAQPVGWFEGDLAGRSAARVVEIGSDAAAAVYQSANSVAYVGTYLVGMVGLLASVDIRLALPLALWLALFAAVTWSLVPWFTRRNEAFHASRSALMGHLVDTFGNIDTVKLFAGPGQIDAEARTRTEEVRQTFFGLQRSEVGINMALTLLEGLVMVALVGWAIHLWSLGAASLGVVASALALVFKITAMVEWVMDGLADIFARVGALREELKTVAQPPMLADLPGAKPLRVPSGGIRIENLRHHYGKGSGGLDGVSLDIAPGEKVALVGRSGAGKSTLVKLMLRFREAEGGRVLIDGQDVRAVTQASLARAVGMVTQEAALLHRSVAQNIAPGQEATLADIEAAARKAEAHGFITGLRDPDGREGYAAHVGERGVRLSGGQRQRIALARVILKDAPILVLDEATSALDSESEAAVLSALYRAMEGKTVIAIAHRLSTIAHMDRIVVLDHGRIAEVGTHSELLARGGLYAGFWARQSGGFIGSETA